MSVNMNSSKSVFIESVISYGLTVPTELHDLKKYEEIVSYAHTHANPKSKIFEQFKDVTDYLDYCKDQLSENPNDTMMALYESVVIKPLNEVNVAGSIQPGAMRDDTHRFSRSGVVYSALNLMLDKGDHSKLFGMIYDLSKAPSFEEK